MGLNYRKRIELGKQTIMICVECKLAYDENSHYCSQCGVKLTKKTSTIYANIGKYGISSISYKTTDGITINSNGKITFPLGKGLSYTTSSKQ